MATQFEQIKRMLRALVGEPEPEVTPSEELPDKVIGTREQMKPSHVQPGDRFAEIIEHTLTEEDRSGKGKITRDAGGLTKWGLSSRSHPDLDIANLSREDAKSIYLNRYWEGRKIKNFHDKHVAGKVFDLSVNMGEGQAVLLAQRAYNDIAKGNKLKDDGIIGPKTLEAINSVSSAEFLEAYRKRADDFYKMLQKKDPKKHGGNRGWFDRLARGLKDEPKKEAK